MADLRTTITELGTGLGMLGYDTVDDALAARPAVMVSVAPEEWDRLTAARSGGGYDPEFHAAFANGRAFLEARFGLRGRLPEIVEWKGSQRTPGDEITPIDLRIDHVYLVSCKYLSKILLNTSPAQLFDHLLVGAGPRRSPDWFAAVAPSQHDELYQIVRQAWRNGDLPIVRDEVESKRHARRRPEPNLRPTTDALPGMAERAAGSATLTGATLAGPRAPRDELPLIARDLDATERTELSRLLAPGWPVDASEAYLALTRQVAELSAERWQDALASSRSARESMLWRLLRMHSAPYFVLGSAKQESLRLRVDTPWDWRQQYRLVRFAVAPQAGGQAMVGFEAVVEDRHTATRTTVEGHIEVRWSHGRFSGPPEAKVYLDTPHSLVPGYMPLE